MSATSLPTRSRPVVHVIHDNPEWIPPFAEAFEAEGVEYVEWLLPDQHLDLSTAPPEGLFWSRLSASSHTRTDPHVKEYGRAVLAWLEAAGRRVVNGAGVYELEVSKVRQHRALEAAGFSVPRTAAVFGHQSLPEVARTFRPPFITKHNQGGKGLGVRRFDSHAELDAAAADFAPQGADAPIDGITLIQDYIAPAQPFITRAEFVGGRLHYAVAVDVSAGSFELCPADACEVPSAAGSAAAGSAAGGSVAEASAGEQAAAPQFSRRDDVVPDDPFIRGLGDLLAAQGIELAGVEFIETAAGERVVYDINTNTNYNPAVESGEAEAGRTPAARAVVKHLKGLLAGS